MKLATYQDDGIKIGIVVDETIIETGFDGTMIELIERWDGLVPLMHAQAASGQGKPLSAVKLCAPILKPAKIWAIGLNYADHIA